jgi:hypothetical protein
MLIRRLGCLLGRRQEQHRWTQTYHHIRPLLLPMPRSTLPPWQLMQAARLLPMSMLLQ